MLAENYSSFQAKWNILNGLLSVLVRFLYLYLFCICARGPWHFNQRLKDVLGLVPSSLCGAQDQTQDRTGQAWLQRSLSWGWRDACFVQSIQVQFSAPLSDRSVLGCVIPVPGYIDRVPCSCALHTLKKPLPSEPTHWQL